MIPSPCRTPRPGFSIVELLVVVMIIGTLAGIALPELRGAALRADAAHVLADSRAVGLAAHTYLSENGRFPATAAAGTVPPEMEEYLHGIPFEYKGMTYSWYGMSIPGGFGASGSRNLGVFMVEFNDQTSIGNTLSGFTGANHYWNETNFYVVFWD